MHLVSDRVTGWRMSFVLDVMEREHLSLDISAVLTLLRQLIPTVSLFARHQRELAVGTIGPEHVILTPQSRLVVTEYVLGAALEKLPITREEMWRIYRVAATPGPTKIWTRSDALSIGITVLSLLHGRRLRDDEFPDRLGQLLEDAQEKSGQIVRPLSPKLSTWLGRALQLDARTGFQSPQEAQVAFEEMLASERSYVTTPALLEAFMTRFKELTAPPPEPKPVPDKRAVAPAVVAEPEYLAIDEAVRSVAPEPPPPPPIPPFTFESVRQSAGLDVPATPIGKDVSTPGDAGLRGRFERAIGGSAKLFAALLVAVLVEAIVIFWMSRDSSETLVSTGELVVQSRPPGATVTLDDKDLGTSPVTVRLSPGTYTLKVQLGNAEPRVIVVQIRAGVQTVQYLELQSNR